MNDKAHNVHDDQLCRVLLSDGKEFLQHFETIKMVLGTDRETLHDMMKRDDNLSQRVADAEYAFRAAARLADVAWEPVEEFLDGERRGRSEGDTPKTKTKTKKPRRRAAAKVNGVALYV